MPEIDLGTIFQPDVSIVEIFIRGTVMYVSVFVLLRVIVKQAAAGLNLADLLLIVLIADAAQNGMAGEYSSIADGLVLVATLAFWSLMIDWLGYHFEFIGRFLHPGPVELVRDGIENRRHMRRELISHDELMTHIRKAGTDDLSQVKRAWVEGNGDISVVLKEGQPNNNASDSKQPA